MKPVDVFIIGAQKCGTTSLLRYLSEHSNILGHMQTEMTYFSVDSEYNKGYDRAWRRYYRSVNQSQSIVIAKNAHMYRNQEAIRRLKLHNPDCKIVFIIRNPVERAYSSYLMEKSSWGEEFSFDEIVDKYLVQDRSNGKLYESPQYMYMLIAAVLFKEYPEEKRLHYVKKYYDAISQFKISVK